MAWKHDSAGIHKHCNPSLQPASHHRFPTCAASLHNRNIHGVCLYVCMYGTGLAISQAGLAL